MTGFTAKQKKAVLDRDNWMCIPHSGGRGQCGTTALVVHHRANRGQGGAKSLNTVANGLTVCATWNTEVEQDAALAEVARHNGWKIPRNGVLTPADIPIYFPPWGVRVWLTDDGNYRETREEEP